LGIVISEQERMLFSIKRERENIGALDNFIEGKLYH